MDAVAYHGVVSGQTWRDRDPRRNGRIIYIRRVAFGRAYFCNARGETRSIRVDRLRPIGQTKGYVLVNVGVYS